MRMPVGEASWCTFHAGGNVEATPPLDGYPNGRVVVGAADQPDSGPPPELPKFFAGMGKQPILYLDTSWLDVGHVDEVMHLTTGSEGELRAIVPDPEAGALLLEDFLQRMAGAKQAGCDLEAISADGPEKKKEFRRRHTGFEQILARTRRAIPHTQRLKASLLAGLKGITPGPKRLEGKVLEQWEATRLQAEEELFIPVPVIFDQKEMLFKPMLPNSVNMLTTRSTPTSPFLHLVAHPHFASIPATSICAEHFGVPLDSEIRDFFAFGVARTLERLGPSHTVQWVDDWGLHTNGGDVHCGTNTIRVPQHLDWWKTISTQQKQRRADDDLTLLPSRTATHRGPDRQSYCPGSLNDLTASLKGTGRKPLSSFESRSPFARKRPSSIRNPHFGKQSPVASDRMSSVMPKPPLSRRSMSPSSLSRPPPHSVRPMSGMPPKPV